MAKKFPLSAHLGITLTWLVIALYMIFLYAPQELTMGEVQRIFYVHFSLAMTALFAYFFVFVGSIVIELFRQWWGPAGFTTEHCEMDIRRGGSQNVLNEFWAPVLQGSKPVLIYTGTNAIYMPTASFASRTEAAGPSATPTACTMPPSGRSMAARRADAAAGVVRSSARVRTVTP